MKKTIIFSGLFLSILINAQKNNVMFNPFSLAFGKIQVGYERPINSNMTLGLTIGAKMSSGVFKISGLNTNAIQTDDFNYKGIELQPEYRWYLQKNVKNYTGFFLGSYYRYRNYNNKLAIVYRPNSADDSKNYNLESGLISHTLGFEVGYKLPVYKNLFVDFIIAGPGVSFNKVTLDTSGVNIEDQFYTDLAAAIKEKYSFVNNLNPNLNFKKDGNSNRSSKIVLPAFNYGVKVGYSF
ncbi:MULTISPECIES: DUF3575 domain-containing protein [Chryseobacterium]|uniref:DUF3575 domain-containing protein n=1 Tax=Chryseobacterium candidae TaxID=1978493 RepID=A0ABY2R7M9_9FLAO|nr:MULTISPECIES: DUF3575 domain-containing protein [Chryseobacterium]PXW16331.1 uncharacterized protein DUF3575 [Chryseobacterium sp. CBTAP 102]THV59813.1 DUF3575 domain-containing protein [Chryseobacterium candidae]SIQ50511.1 Protein of unknown function [Chryseobacterium sp. RU33C]